MTTTSNRQRARQAIDAAIGDNSNRSFAARVRKITCDALENWGAVSIVEGGGRYGLENYGSTTVSRNTNASADAFAIESFVSDLNQLNMKTNHIEDVTDAVLSMFDKSFDKTVVLQRGEVSSSHQPLSQIVGHKYAAMYAREDETFGIESFGDDINRLSTDERVSMDLTIMRPFDNPMDKAFARVTATTPTFTVRIPEPEVYDYALTQKEGSTIADRFDRNTTKLREFYRDPSGVNTAAKRVIPLAANDDNSVLFNASKALYKTGKDVSLGDLARDGSKYGYGHLDRTDLLSDGGRVDSVVISLKSGATTEYFSIPTGALDLAPFVMSPSTKSSGQRQVMLECAIPVSVGTTQFDGSASTIAASLVNARVIVTARLNVTLDIKTGRLNGSGSATIDYTAVAGQTIAAEVETIIGALTTTVAAFSVEVYFDEQNQRKSNLAVWCNYKQLQYMVPRSRFFIAEYALAQDVDDNTTAALSTLMSLGNGRRNLDILVDTLNRVAEGAAIAAAYPEVAETNTFAEQSFASSMVKPTVVSTTLDYSDEPLNVMNESTRLSEMHGRFRARMLEMVAQLYTNSLMHNNTKAGEVVVLKAFTHVTIADLIMGIPEYNPVLNDKTNTASGADFSFLLPNGVRVDVIKTNFDCLKQRVYAVPVIESDPSSILSGAHIRDCGSVSLNYAPTNMGSITRRVATTTREILVPTNHVGIMMEVVGIEDKLGENGFAQVLLNADSNNSIAV